MINLIVSVFGALLIIGGLYFMYLGLKIPPNPIAFFVGLIAAVFGLILLIFFGSKIDLSRGATSKPKKIVSPKPSATKITKPIKVAPKEKKPSISRDESKSKVIKPKRKADEQPKFGPSKTITPTIKKDKTEPKKVEKPKKAAVTPKTITPQAKPKADTTKSTSTPPDVASKKKVTPKKISPVKKEEKDKNPAKFAGKKIEPIKTPEPVKKPVKPTEEKIKPPAPKSVLETADKERLKELQTRPGRDDQFVKNRLDKLKENYIENAKDIESIIDERLDSFKGTIDKLKTDSQEPSIIWSFEAQDVQEAMKDTIITAENHLLMMYPWVRNIDVGILKKFMDTKSRMIIQEASLDDDASVELIKLLQEKNVDIRTMPHVHTVAVVADDANGLIISTDPIYESYEVGVIYKDKKSIMEIERMFEDAWTISQDIDLEIRK
ncbi:DUF308 domain-containing protein [Methanobacterium petrolearium]|uniref:DUF308 domain-containing protein n=1 Tax=Methanobacterium petrolearium TaxID=710190 RepID=UPI001AE4A09A|nr:DUF308 domain-containing protein [Methanobacterium petrolearium]MBP1945586.1 hypothetical protein [Methanobacterium petrolearium]